MIMQVLADSREIDNSGNTNALVEGRVTDTRNLEDLRGVEGTSSKNDLLASGGSLDIGTLAGGELRIR